MCGICGFVRHDARAPAPREAVARMGDALAHRGPDHAGAWCEGPAALGHRRLSILDTSPAGNQPWLSRDGRHAAVYNGEIYNFRELRNALRSQGYTFETQCDTEVLVAAHAAWGGQAADRFLGMFAYAVYDLQDHRLTLVRDRLGIKPLYYAERPDGLAFASELGALRAGGYTGHGVDAAALDAYLRYLYIPGPRTIYPAVRELMPGERLVLEAGAVQRNTWWRPQPVIREGWTLDEAAEQYAALLADSVRLRMISDVPLGAFLSGGLDSSSVVAVMSQLTDRPVKTFSIGFDDRQANELAYARTAAKAFGTDHTESVVTPDMVNLAPRFARHFGQPFADSSALPMWLVSQVARSEVTVALSGDGGDELFGGYTWTHRALAAGRYARIPAGVRSVLGAGLGLLPPSALKRKLLRFHGDARLPAPEQFRRRLTCFDSAARQALLRPEAAALCDSDDDPFMAYWNEEPALDPGSRMLHVDTRMYLPGDILTKVDRMSMAHGLEARVPLLDHRIVEFAATAPFALKYDGRVSKRLVKHAMRDVLPGLLLKQRKQGFAIPIQRWFRGELAPMFQDSVLSGESPVAELVDQRILERTFAQHQRRQAEHGHHLWAALMLDLWLRDAG